MSFTQLINKCSYYLGITFHRIGLNGSIVYQDNPAKVVDGIYIGSIATTNYTCLLKYYNIGTIVNLSGLKVNTIDFEVVDLVMADEIITPRTLPLYISEFSRGLDAITAAHSGGHSVLVNCAAGINRSATLIGLWLILVRKMTYTEAIAALETANKTRGLPALTNLSFRDFLLNAYVICHEKDRRRHRRVAGSRVIIV